MSWFSELRRWWAERRGPELEPGIGPARGRYRLTNPILTEGVLFSVERTGPAEITVDLVDYCDSRLRIVFSGVTAMEQSPEAMEDMVMVYDLRRVGTAWRLTLMEADSELMLWIDHTTATTWWFSD